MSDLEVFAWARARGCVRAHVTAYAANHGAQRFYARHGFTPHETTLAVDLAGGGPRWLTARLATQTRGRDVAKGTLRGILRDVGMTTAQLGL